MSAYRLVAKIAWGVALVNGQYDRLSPELCEAFMHKPENIGRWVGTYTDPPGKVEENMLHEVRIREDHKRNLLLADVKLFSNSETPRYAVVLGTMQEAKAA